MRICVHRSIRVLLSIPASRDFSVILSPDQCAVRLDCISWEFARTDFHAAAFPAANRRYREAVPLTLSDLSVPPSLLVAEVLKHPVE